MANRASYFLRLRTRLSMSTLEGLLQDSCVGPYNISLSGIEERDGIIRKSLNIQFADEGDRQRFGKRFRKLSGNKPSQGTSHGT